MVVLSGHRQKEREGRNVCRGNKEEGTISLCDIMLKWSHVHLQCIVIPVEVPATPAGPRSPTPSFAPPAEAVA